MLLKEHQTARAGWMLFWEGQFKLATECYELTTKSTASFDGTILALIKWFQEYQENQPIFELLDFVVSKNLFSIFIYWYFDI